MLQYDKKEILNYIINIRRHLHSIPEIGTNLPQTQEYVIKKLEELKIEYKKNQKDSGVVAIIKSNNTNKKTVALRADMDALPMKEETDFEYKSTNENMHACGHDVHTAILLGVCKILSENKDILKNDVKFIFQTAEETGEGAKIMIEENALQNVDAIFGIHIGTIAENVESGQFVIQSGPLMAAVDRIVIKVKGKGTHGAYPHTGIDPIVMSGEIITSLQSIISREIDTANSIILSLCRISGGSAFNIIPDVVEIEGTIRSFDKNVRNFLVERIKDKCDLIAKSMRGECEVIVYEETLVTNNDEGVTQSIIDTARQIFDDKAIYNKHYIPSMGGEDFSFYQEKTKGAFAFFSTATEKNIPHHNSKFEVDESKLNMPAELMANWANNY